MPDHSRRCSVLPYCERCHILGRAAKPSKYLWPGYSHRKDQGLYVAEIRPPGWRGKQKIGLGSYATEIAAAMAFDVGIHYTNKQLQVRQLVKFNILSRAPCVPPLPSGLSLGNGNDVKAIREFVQETTKKFVKVHEHLVPALPPGLSCANSNEADAFRTAVRQATEKFVDVPDEHGVETAAVTARAADAENQGSQETEAVMAVAGPSSSSQAHAMIQDIDRVSLAPAAGPSSSSSQAHALIQYADRVASDPAAGPSSFQDHAQIQYAERVASDPSMQHQGDQIFWESLLLNPLEVNIQGSHDVAAPPAALPLPEKLSPSSQDQLVNSFPDSATLFLPDKLPNEGV